MRTGKLSPIPCPAPIDQVVHMIDNPATMFAITRTKAERTPVDECFRLQPKKPGRFIRRQERAVIGFL